MKNSGKSIRNIFLATAAITAFVSSPLRAADDDLVSGATPSRQIIVQEAGQKAEVKNLVTKLKKSQNSLDNPKRFRAPKINPEPEEKEIVAKFRAPKPDPTPEIEEERTAEISSPIEEINDDVFAPKAKAKVKTTKVKMPTVFTAEQVDLYNNLTSDEQIALVRRLATKYGLDRLYPTKQANDYHNNKYATKYSYSQKYNNHSNSYSHNNSYSSAYSTSNYSAGGCKK